MPLAESLVPNVTLSCGRLYEFRFHLDGSGPFDIQRDDATTNWFGPMQTACKDTERACSCSRTPGQVPCEKVTTRTAPAGSPVCARLIAITGNVAAKAPLPDHLQRANLVGTQSCGPVRQPAVADDFLRRHIEPELLFANNR